MTQPANRRLATEAYVTTTAGALQKVAATVTASGALVVAKHNPVNATSGAKTMTLPTGQAEGVQVSVEKTDSSANVVSVTGSIRGVGSSTITLPWQNEALLLRADSAGSWWPISGHKTKGSLDAAYLTSSIVAPRPTGVAATDTANLYAALNAVPDAGRLWLPASPTPYAYDPSIQQLTVTRSITIEGESSVGVYNASAASASPYVKGSVINVVTAGYDALSITTPQISVNLKNFSILFQSGLASTGHGVNANPGILNSPYYAIGLYDFLFENVRVAGHDGSHYGFNIMNPLQGTLRHLRTVGGGGIRLISNSNQHSYGNMVIVHPYINLLNAGTAHGICHESDNPIGGGPGGTGANGLELLTYIRPQVEVGPSVNTTQLAWQDSGGTRTPISVTLVAPDMETSGTQTPNFGPDTYILGDPFLVNGNSNRAALGKGAFPYNNTATGVGVGSSALAAVTTGLRNTAVGSSSLVALTTGADNVAVGNTAGAAITTASGLTAVGSGAGTNATAQLTAVGYHAAIQVTSGGSNTAVGSSALAAVTTNTNNTAVGAGAMAAGTGDSNTAVGNNALGLAAFSNAANTAVGRNALYSYAGTGTGNNTAVGHNCLSQQTTGGDNTAIGQGAGVTATTANATTTGSHQTMVGWNAGQSVATQLSNITALGDTAQVGGNNGTALGYHTTATGAGSVAIGADNTGAGATATLQNAIALGTSAHQVQIANNTTGAGSAALGANCPATTATAPYTWFKMLSSDGSTVYVPCWK